MEGRTTMTLLASSTVYTKAWNLSRGQLSIHRADLQKALLNALNSEQEAAQSCKVLLGKKVVQAVSTFRDPADGADGAQVPEAGTVTTADGSLYSADVVIGENISLLPCRVRLMKLLQVPTAFALQYARPS
jgi:2-polyprenyl-6-methoxyphenol hydroxylase-like FAD-dependent oxidoreductase